MGVKISVGFAPSSKVGRSHFAERRLSSNTEYPNIRTTDRKGFFVDTVGG